MQQVGRYQILGEIGRGAMGIVYKALDPAIGRTVAIKTIRLRDLTDAAERDRLRERLFREAQSAGVLSHPGIVTIYDILESDGLAYIFMEYVNGPALDKILDRPQGMEPETFLSILHQTSVALDYAHKRGIVHRDIKPANVMIHEDGSAKITDFGVAKIMSQQMTQAGMMMGTPSYMSPEQIQGGAITGRADQFALAVIAYEVLTGEKPFAADHLPTLLFKILRDAPAPPHRLNTSLSPDVEPVLQRGLAKLAEDRFENCVEFATALAAALGTASGWMPLPRGASGEMPTVAQAAPPPSPPVSAPVEETAALAAPAASSAGADDAHGGHAPQSLENLPISPAGLSASSGAAVIPPPIPAAATSTADPPIETPPVWEPRRRREDPPNRLGSLLLITLLFIGIVGGAAYWLFLMPGAASPVPAAEAEPLVDAPPGPAGDTKSPDSEAAQQETLTQEAPLQEASSQETPSQEVPGGIAATPASSVGPDAEATPPPGQTQPQQAAASAATPPPVRRPPGPTEFVLRTAPEGAVAVFDNDPRTSCTTPCTLTLTPGRHTLVARNEGYRPAQRIINFPETTSVTVELARMTGTLALTTRPAGLTVFIDGREQATKTPLNVVLPAGPHRVTVVHGSQRQDINVQISDGAMTAQSVQWQ